MPKIIVGDAMTSLKALPDQSVHCCVTSPPYWGLRDYGVPGQIGLEPNPEEYVMKMVEVFSQVKRVLRDDGTLWLNLGDSYSTGGKQGHRRGVRFGGFNGKLPAGNFTPPAGLKRKELVGIPWLVAFALQRAGWYLRSDIIWSKPNPMPESVTDRPTKSHEYIFLLSKSKRYFYDVEAIKEPCVQKEFRPSFRGGAYVNNSTFDNQIGGKSTDVGNVKRTKSWKGSDFHDGKNLLTHPNVGKNRKWDEQGRQSSGQRMVDNTAAARLNGGTHDQPFGDFRNARSVWNIATQPFKNAHFATFPVKLVEPCIKAGTSEKGCCPVCGAPWVRITKPSDRYAKILGESYHDHKNDIEMGMMSVRGGNKQNKMRDAGINGKETVTLGWKPTCKHGGDPIPCTVLDPFAGSGTTGQVARDLGRDFMLIELNEKYIDMAMRRINDLFTNPEVRINAS